MRVTTGPKPFTSLWNPIQPRVRNDVLATQNQGSVPPSTPWVIPGLLTQPAGWSNPKTILVGSGYDPFHRDVPDHYIQLLLEVMERIRWHTFCVEVANPERMKGLLAGPLRSAAELPNVYWGVRACTSEELPRIEVLRSTQVTNSFIIFGPLEKYLSIRYDANLGGIKWVVADGTGEALPRSLRRSCFQNIRDHCRSAQVPFFFTGWEPNPETEIDRQLDGELHSDHPAQPTEGYPDWEDFDINLDGLVELIDGFRTWAVGKDPVIDCDECGQPALFKRLAGLDCNPNAHDCCPCDTVGCPECCSLEFYCAEHEMTVDHAIPVADSFADYVYDNDGFFVKRN